MNQRSDPTLRSDPGHGSDTTSHADSVAQSGSSPNPGSVQASVIAASVVMPVRNAEKNVGSRVRNLLAEMQEVRLGSLELLVVNDGSTDQTLTRLHELQKSEGGFRVISHDRARGMEAAGQTGLERARGAVVLVIENQLPCQVSDLVALLQVAEDRSIAAARSESRCERPNRQLLRRMKCWGVDFEQHLAPEVARFAAVQMVRRSHFNRLAGPSGQRLTLTSQAVEFSRQSSLPSP